MRDEPNAWSEVVIPDDIRELDADVAAYRRELRHARRRRLLTRRRTGPLLGLVIATMLAGLIALMLTVMAPQAVDEPIAAAPLAHPTAADGTLHGLLPDAELVGPGGQVDSRSATLRPAVFALVPAGCDCRALLDGLAGQAFSERLPLAVVVAAVSDSKTAAVVHSLDRGTSALYLDPAGSLASTVVGTALPQDSATIVVVDRDGTIFDIERGITDPSTTSLDAALQSMLVTG